VSTSLGRGLIIAAPSSGSGKTMVTLGLLRALRNNCVDIGSLKIGPDYIDPAFHTFASGKPCRTLDPWSMRPETFHSQVAETGAEFLLAEGVMGLFDGAVDGTGSTADAAETLGWPVILVVDVKGQSASAAAVVEGFARHRKGVTLAGVIFNRVGGNRHKRMLEEALAPMRIPCLGHVPWSSDLELPSRHLGLVQAREHAEFETWIKTAADIIGSAVNLELLSDLAEKGSTPTLGQNPLPLPVFGSHVAIARDDAFAFTYPHILEAWEHAGATLSYFSPLADDPVPAEANGVYLPGGYPELHAATLGENETFLSSLKTAAGQGVNIYGECGGFMVLGDTLTDAEGIEHGMAGLLPVHTSFAERKLHLGYRSMVTQTDSALGPAGTLYKGHEFHYASITRSTGEPLFEAEDALGENKSLAGAVSGTVCGSFMHIIDSVTV